MICNLLKSACLIFLIACSSAAAAGRVHQTPDPTELLELVVAKINTDGKINFAPSSAVFTSKLDSNPELAKPLPSFFLKDFNESLPSLENVVSQPPFSRPSFMQVFRETIASPENQNDSEKKQQLSNLIEQLRSVEFDKHSKTNQPSTADSSQNKESGAKKAEKSESKSQTPKIVTRPEPNTSPDPNKISAQTLKIIQSLCDNPKQVNNPLELAEVLFLSGYLKQAAVFYKEQLNRYGENPNINPADKAWVMFQTANCLREENSADAAGLYKKMISEFPDCSWSELARSRVRILEWLSKDKPEQLLKSRNK
jgi:TolA-binding protein